MPRKNRGPVLNPKWIPKEDPVPLSKPVIDNLPPISEDVDSALPPETTENILNNLHSPVIESPAFPSVNEPFFHEGITVTTEYTKPFGFEATLLSQRGRISDTALDLSLIELYGALGLTDEVIAKLHGVSPVTILRWKDIPAFKEALDRGKRSADAEIVKKLFQRAAGYITYEHLREIRRGAAKDGGDIIIERVIRKEVPPDVEAMQFWLMNRQKELWKKVWKMDGKFLIERVVKELVDLSDQELSKLASENRN